MHCLLTNMPIGLAMQSALSTLAMPQNMSILAVVSLAVVHPASWLGHRAKGLVGLGFELSAGTGRGGFSDFPNGYLPLRGVNMRIWLTPSNKPSPAWNKDVKSLTFF